METVSALLALCAGNSPHKGQRRGALMFALICAWINGWVNHRKACDLRRHCSHYDVIVMCYFSCSILMLFFNRPLNLYNRLYWQNVFVWLNRVFPDSKVHGANMGPSWGRQDPGGPHDGHMNLTNWDLLDCSGVILQLCRAQCLICSVSVPSVTSQSILYCFIESKAIVSWKVKRDT